MHDIFIKRHFHHSREVLSIYFSKL